MFSTINAYITNLIEAHPIDPFTDSVGAFLSHGSIFLPFLFLLIEEAGVPVPIPGDAVIAFIGYQISRGNISYAVSFILFLISVLAGSSILYYLSYRYGEKLVVMVGKYLHVNEKKLTLARSAFKEFGPIAIIFGRHIPGFRIPITIFAGLSEIKYKTFILCEFISVVLWIPIYLSIGERLGPKTVKLFHAHHWYFVIAAIPLLFFLGSYIYVKVKEFRQKRKHQRETKDSD